MPGRCNVCHALGALVCQGIANRSRQDCRERRLRGGYLAAATALVPGWDDPQDNLVISPKPNALVLFFPVVNVGPEAYDQHRFGYAPRKYSPEAYISRNSPPTIIEGGGADKLVKPEILKDASGVNAVGPTIFCAMIHHPMTEK